MMQALIALVMSALEFIELWTGFVLPGISADWIETLLIMLTPLLVWMVPEMIERRALDRVGKEP